MELSTYTLVLLPVGLGLLGFVEPCTIGGHMLFLDSQRHRPRTAKIGAVLVFSATRSLVSGLAGALVAILGHQLIQMQAGLWLLFGIFYLTIGLIMIGNGRLVRWRSINLAPGVRRRAKNPLVLGLAFGANIPACAAPILFGLLGLAATGGSVLAGFAMMYLFGLALSLPLMMIALAPWLSDRLDALGAAMWRYRWVPGAAFVLVGLWSVWFGLFVDPADWSGL